MRDKAYDTFGHDEEFLTKHRLTTADLRLFDEILHTCYADHPHFYRHDLATLHPSKKIALTIASESASKDYHLFSTILSEAEFRIWRERHE